MSIPVAPRPAFRLQKEQLQIPRHGGQIHLLSFRVTRASSPYRFFKQGPQNCKKKMFQDTNPGKRDTEHNRSLLIANRRMS